VATIEEGPRCFGEFQLRATDLLNPDLPMRRITSLSILFAALIEFAIERARLDLWIVAVVAIVTLLWNVAGRTLTP